MTVAQLREIASGIDHPAVQGYTQLRKEQIIEGICTALDIDMMVHKTVVGIDKTSIKRQIKALRQERDKALEAHDSAELKRVRRKMHHLKRRLHRATRIA